MRNISFSVFAPDFTMAMVEQVVWADPALIELWTLSSYTTNKHFFEEVNLKNSDMITDLKATEC